MRTLDKYTKAFTLIELVFVIIVLGILASLALPRMDRDLRQEAADNVLSAIRYTQHMALTDNKTDPTDGTWQKRLWKISFTNAASGSYYTVSSENNVKNAAVDKPETAIDPTNGKYMYHLAPNAIQTDESPNILIGEKYGIDNNIAFAGAGCPNQHIAFDQLGRPHNGITTASNNYDKYMTTNCTITFSFINNAATAFQILIERETGYASIVGQAGS